MFHTIWGILLAAGYLLTWALIPWVLLKKKVHPTASVAWIMAIIFIPYFGALLCLVFGLNRVERHKARKREASQQMLARSPIDDDGWNHSFNALSHPQQTLVRLLERLNDMPLTFGNDVKILPEKQIAFERIEEVIRSARESLHIEFYIWRPDDTGSMIRDLLVERARHGVEVRFIYDGLGSMELGRHFLRPMYEAGIHVAPFLPGRSFRERWSINLRNHRKLIVADGRVALTGGLNVGDEYLGKSDMFGDLRDTQIELRGPVVRQLQEVFIEDWYFSTGEDLTDAKYYPELPHVGNVPAQAIADGPDTEPDVFHSLLFAAINQAQERIELANPYFIPPASLAMALETAARRGVRVRLLIAGSDTFPWTLLAGRSYYDGLLAAGIEVYEYQRGLYHPKTLTIDGDWSLIGTMNFDNRSLKLNFEVAVAFYDRTIAAQLEQQFEHDLQYATRIDPNTWFQRSTWHQLGENFCRLFEPVL